MTEISTDDASNRVSIFGVQSITLLIICGIALFFYFEYATQYFLWDEEIFGPYYWGKKASLILHIGGASLALFMGPPQLWMGLRNRYMRVHRWTGRLYLVGVFVGSVGAFLMATTPEQILGWGFAFSLFGLAIAWVVTTGLAFLSIIRRKFLMHKEWMIRSYIVTFSFVSFRILVDYVPHQSWGLDMAEYYTAMMWSCWVFPLMVAEVIIQGRRL